jgi:dTMP kinase
MTPMPASQASTTAPRSHARGLFLTLDGPDGGGKSTQAGRLAGWLRGRGAEVVTCQDPGGTALGERLREIVLGRATVNLALRAEMLLYMASRAQLVEEVIRPGLAAGRLVVSDRFLLANIVYQGDAGGLPVEEVARVGQAATGGLLPDLTLVLDIAPEAARARVGRARDRIEDRPADYHRRVRDGFLRAAQSGDAFEGRCPYYPAPIVVIDAAAEPDMVFERIRNEVERALALGPRP